MRTTQTTRTMWWFEKRWGGFRVYCAHYRVTGSLVYMAMRWVFEKFRTIAHGLSNRCDSHAVDEQVSVFSLLWRERLENKYEGLSFKLWDNLDTTYVLIGKKRKSCCASKLLENCCYIRCFMKQWTTFSMDLPANKPLWGVRRTSACKWKRSSCLEVMLPGVLTPQNQSCVCQKLLLNTTASLAGFPQPRTYY